MYPSCCFLYLHHIFSARFHLLAAPSPKAEPELRASLHSPSINSQIQILVMVKQGAVLLRGKERNS